MRHRSNPGCMDEVVTQKTLRNIYLCIWHVMRKEESNSEHQSQVDNLARMLALVLRGNNLNDDDNDDDVTSELARIFVNDKMRRNIIPFTPLMFYIASFLIEKNVELDTFDHDDFIFNFKNDLNSEMKSLIGISF